MPGRPAVPGRIALGLVAAAGLLAAGCSGGSGRVARSPATTGAGPAPTTPTSVVRTTVLHATLTGAEEVPGPGAESGFGQATVTLDPGKGEICYDLSVRNMEAATLAHVHTGPAGVRGPVAVNLAPPAAGASHGCVPVPTDLVESIAANPGGFYVNVHNAAFPDGAIRGQLSP